MSFIFNLCMGICFIIAMSMLFKICIRDTVKRKTKEYREDLTNLYVAGKIKKIAKTEDIDLDNELKSFRKFEKTMNTSYKELDDVLENEMKEKIREDFEKAKSK